IMKPELESFDLVIKHQLTPAIFSLTSLAAFVNTIKGLPTDKKFNIHLKLDTGMHRLGLKMEELDEVIKTIQQNPNIIIESVFSQLTSSDNHEEDAFSFNQMKQFERMAEKISTSFKYKIDKH